MMTQFTGQLQTIYRRPIDYLQWILSVWRSQCDQSLPIALVTFLWVLMRGTIYNTETLGGFRALSKKYGNSVHKKAPMALWHSPANESKLPKQTSFTYRPTLMAQAVNPQTGKCHQVRLLLDTGAATSSITERCARILDLTPQFRWPAPMLPFPGIPKFFTHSHVHLILKSLDGQHCTPPLQIDIEKHPYFQLWPMYARIPCREVADNAAEHCGVVLTECLSVDESRYIDILIGQDYLYSEILSSPEEWRQLDENLAFFKTCLGWSTMGTFKKEKYTKKAPKEVSIAIEEASKEKSRPSNGLQPITENTDVSFEQLNFNRDSFGFFGKLSLIFLYFIFLNNVFYLALLSILILPLLLCFRLIQDTAMAIFSSTSKRPISFHSIRPVGLLSSLYLYVPSIFFVFFDVFLTTYYCLFYVNFSEIFNFTSSPKTSKSETVPFFMTPHMSVRLSNVTLESVFVEENVLLDSGASFSCIDARLADELQAVRSKDSAGNETVTLRLSSLDPAVFQSEGFHQIECLIHSSPIDRPDEQVSPQLGQFVSKRYGITFPQVSSVGSTRCRVILGCDVLASVFFPSPYSPVQVQFTPKSNLWLIATRQGWTVSGNSGHRHDWRHVRTYMEICNFRQYKPFAFCSLKTALCLFQCFIVGYIYFCIYIQFSD